MEHLPGLADWFGVDMPKGTCSIDDCTKPAGARGWCTAHYTRWHRHGDPLGGRERYGTPGCEQPGCERPHHSSGMCRQHAAKHWRATRPECTEDGCHRPQRVRQWCSAHYQRWRNHGHQHSGGPVRRDRGTGYSPDWYSEHRRRKIGLPSPETLEYVQILRGDPCSYCGAPWEHTDHIEPVSAGGLGDWTNLTAACASCNHAKSTKPLLGFLLHRLG